MSPDSRTGATRALIAATFLAIATTPAGAGPLHDWDRRARDVIAESGLEPAAARRAMATVRRSTSGAIAGLPRGGAHGPAVEAALVTAHFVALAAMFPDRVASLEAAFHASLARIPESPAKATGISAGATAAAAAWNAARRGTNMVAAAAAAKPCSAPGGTAGPTAAAAAASPDMPAFAFP
jgi:hypothetical protein